MGNWPSYLLQFDGFAAGRHWFRNGTAQYAVGHQTKAGIRPEQRGASRPSPSSNANVLHIQPYALTLRNYPRNCPRPKVGGP
jgi:hypothetical protein